MRREYETSHGIHCSFSGSSFFMPLDNSIIVIEHCLIFPFNSVSIVVSEKWLIRILMCWDGEDGERGVVDVRDLGEVEGDAVEKEVGVSGSVVDADEALEILVESLRLGIALPAVEVPQNGGGV